MATVTVDNPRKVLERHLPPSAVAPFLEYWQTKRLALHISRGRQSKLGDYRRPQSEHEQHRISVNGDLCPNLFLWVLLHEMAHLDTHETYGIKAAPHGHEWQRAYARLLNEYLHCFPPELQGDIERYCSRIPLYHPLQQKIELQMRQTADGVAERVLTLDGIGAGCRFRLKNQPAMLFESMEKRRTRWRCKELYSGRMYLINGTAEVEKEEEPTL